MGALGDGQRGRLWLARYERNIHDGAARPLGMEELLRVLNADGQHDAHARQHAIACYLAAGEGWRDALNELGGAFAADGPGLKARKGP